jgi:hypothetical protein
MGAGSGVINLGANLQLVGVNPPSVVRQGSNARFHIFFQTLGAEVDMQVDTEIVAADGTVVGTLSVRETIEADRHAPTRVSYSVPLPEHLAPGAYTGRITIRDAGTGEPLATTSAATGEQLPVPITLGEFDVAVIPETEPGR